MDEVRMRHPETGAEINATPDQAAHYQRSGWQAVSGQPTRWPAELQRFEGQEQVRLWHPGLPNTRDEPLVVAASAVGLHRDKGWLRYDEQPPTEQAAEGLDEKTVPELRELAKQQGISPLPTTKPELLEALRNSPAEQAAEPPSQQPAEQAPTPQASEEAEEG